MPPKLISVLSLIIANQNLFLVGKPAGLTDYMNPDWIPSVNMGYKAKIKTLGCSSRFQSLNKGIALKTEITEVRLSLE